MRISLSRCPLFVIKVGIGAGLSERLKVVYRALSIVPNNNNSCIRHPGYESSAGYILRRLYWHAPTTTYPGINHETSINKSRDEHSKTYDTPIRPFQYGVFLTDESLNFRIPRAHTTEPLPRKIPESGGQQVLIGFESAAHSHSTF
jgi:hypothetical protein